MQNRAAKLDWAVIDDEEVWLARYDAPPTSPLPEGGPALLPSYRKHKEVWMSLLAAAVIFAFLGGWRWRQQGVMAQERIELEQAVAQAVPGHSTEESQSQPQVQIDQTERQGDRVLAQVLVAYPEGATTRTYRESRFMERSADNWQRIETDPALMGPEQTLQLAHFTIYYRAADAGAVHEAAPRLENLYAKLRHDLSLEGVIAPRVYTIELATSVVMNNSQSRHSDAQIIVPSPTLLSAPAEMSPGSVLYDSLVYPLARQVVGDFGDQGHGQWLKGINGRFMVKAALSLWELWEDGGALATGRAELVRWAYAQDNGLENRQPLPDGYDQLCRMYQIWHISPWQLFIPLSCTSKDRLIWSTSGDATPSVREQELQDRGSKRSQLVSAIDDVVMGETVIEYVVATYGRERLPAFVEALEKNYRLDDVIPASFGVWPDEFEAGWQAYVQLQYLDERHDYAK